MTSENAAPDEMPGVEEIDRLCMDLDTANTVREPQRCADLMDAARLAILTMRSSFAPIMAENAALKTTEGAARAWCRSKGIDPDFYYDGARDWQKLALIDITSEDLKAALAEEEDDHRKTEARALAAEAALAAAEDVLCNLMNAAGHYKSTHSEDDRAALTATIKAAANYVEAAAIRAEGE